MSLCHNVAHLITVRVPKVLLCPLLFNNYYPLVHSNNSNRFSKNHPTLTVVGSNSFFKPLGKKSFNHSIGFQLTQTHSIRPRIHIRFTCQEPLSTLPIFYCQYHYCSSVFLLFSSRTCTSHFHQHEICVHYRL